MLTKTPDTCDCGIASFQGCYDPSWFKGSDDGTLVCNFPSTMFSSTQHFQHSEITNEGNGLRELSCLQPQRGSSALLRLQSNVYSCRNNCARGCCGTGCACVRVCACVNGMTATANPLRNWVLNSTDDNISQFAVRLSEDSRQENQDLSRAATVI